MIGMQVISYKDLIVWQKAMELVVAMYKFTDQLPKSELYGLISQMRRSTVSIPCNIAEGRKMGSKIEFRRFLMIAYGSGSELETQMEIVKRLPFGKELDSKKIDGLLDEVMRMLNAMLKNLSDSVQSLTPKS